MSETDIVLISPRTNRLNLFRAFVPLSVPVGIGTLASYLIMRGKKVKAIDEVVAPLCEEDVCERVNSTKIFGVSCMTANIGRGYHVADLIKKRYPDSIIVFGGIHPTVLPGEVLQNKNVDVVVRGEGEVTLDALCNKVMNDLEFREVPGISYRDKNNNIVHNPPGEIIKDLDSLPQFPYHLFDREKYDLGFITSSRGCPYDCIFCSQRAISGQRYRYRSTENVIAELKLLIDKYSQKEILFMDDIFTVNRNRVFQLCESIIKNDLHEKAVFSIQTRGDSVDEEMLKIMKKAGFGCLMFGLETASERLMKLINKKETVKDNIEAVKLAKKYGFIVDATFIFGLPTEEAKDRRDAYRLAKELDIDRIRFNNAAPYPGTKLYEIAKQEGRLYIEKDWENFNSVGVLVAKDVREYKLPYIPTTTTKEELVRDIVKANVFYYLRVKSLKNLLFKNAQGSAKWFVLPKEFYLKPREVLNLVYMSLCLLKNLFLTFTSRELP